MTHREVELGRKVLVSTLDVGVFDAASENQGLLEGQPAILVVRVNFLTSQSKHS